MVFEKGEDVEIKFFLWYCWDKHKWSGSRLVRPMIVAREKLWSLSQSSSMSGKSLRFLQALYQGSVCRVKVDGQVSEDLR